MDMFLQIDNILDQNLNSTGPFGEKIRITGFTWNRASPTSIHITRYLDKASDVLYTASKSGHRNFDKIILSTFTSGANPVKKMAFRLTGVSVHNYEISGQAGDEGTIEKFSLNGLVGLNFPDD